jgi:hypothetical protein
VVNDIPRENYIRNILEHMIIHNGKLTIELFYIMYRCLIEHVLKSMVRCVAVPVVAPVASRSTFVCRLTLIKSAAVVIVALCISSGHVVWVDVDVGELQYF